MLTDEFIIDILVLFGIPVYQDRIDSLRSTGNQFNIATLVQAKYAEYLSLETELSKTEYIVKEVDDIKFDVNSRHSRILARMDALKREIGLLLRLPSRPSHVQSYLSY